MRASTRSKAKTKHSRSNLAQTRPPRRIRPPSKPSPISSITSSLTASPSKPRPCSQSSSPTCGSTAGRKSYPPTESAHPWFARRQVQWSQPTSSRTAQRGCRAGGCRFTTPISVAHQHGFATRAIASPPNERLLCACASPAVAKMDPRGHLLRGDGHVLAAQDVA